MSISLSNCPVCGLPAEWVWRGHGPATRFLAVKCPNGHHRESMSYHHGSEKLAAAEMAKRWEMWVGEAVHQLREGKA